MANDGNPADLARALDHECVIIPIRENLWRDPPHTVQSIVDELLRAGVVPTEREMIFIQKIEELRGIIRQLKDATEGE